MPGRTVKSCGPDPPMLGSNPWADEALRGRWLESCGTPRRPRISRKTIAQGVPVVSAALSLLACAEVRLFCTQGSRVRPASGTPCALCFRGRLGFLQNPGRSCRGNVKPCPRPPLSPGLTGGPSTPRLPGSSRAASGILDRPVEVFSLRTWPTLFRGHHRHFCLPSS